MTDQPEPSARSQRERRSVAAEGEIIAGKYQVVRLLGEGGMSSVFEARHVNTHRRCAVKLMLSPELESHPELMRRFVREARASSVVESEHIVQVFDSGNDPETGRPYMVMELLDGEDLQHLLDRVGAIEPMAAAKIILQASIGLAKAHELGIVHRDIKPANLFLSPRSDGQILVKILDFGIAKVKMESFAETQAGLTKSGSMLGTPLYMSPEQARGRSNIDVRSDVWSLGIVLFVLLSGALPYDSTTLGELLVAIITSDLPLLQDRAPWVPPELAEIVHRAMSRDIDRRYANAGELRDALFTVTQGDGRVAHSELTGVPGERKRMVAPRLELSNDGFLRATARSGVSVTKTEPPSASNKWVAVAAIAVGGIAAVSVAGLAVTKFLKRNVSPERALTSATLSATQAPTGITVEPAPPQRRYNVAIVPADAEVTIDGDKQTLRDGNVEISGVLGDTRRIKVTVGARSTEQVIAITQAGPVPERVTLEVPDAGTPTTVADRSATDPKKTSTTKKTEAKKEPDKTEKSGTAKPKPPIETSTDEFNK